MTVNVLEIFMFLILPFAVLRLFRWVAIVQQKEYRWDRLRLFFQTTEGKKELFTFWYFPKRKADIKRPHHTLRAWSVIGLTLLTSYFINSIFLYVWTFFILYLALPFLVILAIIPTMLLAQFLTYLLLFLAREKVRHHRPMIIGITGSYGKTSTKQLLAHVLARKYSVFTTPKSYNTRYSVAKSIFTGYQGQEIIILEYGAYTKGEIKTLTKWFKPNHAILTGIAPQHLGLFGTVNAIMAAKSELIKALPPEGVVFANDKNSYVQQMTEDIPNRVIGYTKKDQLKVLKAELNDDGGLIIEWQQSKIHTQLIGIHYLETIQAVIAVARMLGLKPNDIQKQIQSFVPSPNFIQSKSLKNGALLIDDGKTSNQAGFEAVIELAKSIKQKKKILLSSGIVDLGEQSTQIHLQLAQQAKTIFNTVLYVGTDGAEAFKQIFNKHCFTKDQDLQLALKQLDKDSLLLIEGKIKPDLLNKISMLMDDFA